MDSEVKKLVVLYGSQTGTCEEVAERICLQSRGTYFKFSCMALDDYPIDNLINEELVLFICSTTGQGVPPDNMCRFWKFIMRKSLPHNCLSDLNYSVLGLGDSSYNKYNFVAKKLFRRVEMLGATAICHLALADDQHEWGPDAVIDPWTTDVWKSILSKYPDSSRYLNPLNNLLPPPIYTVQYQKEDNSLQYVATTPSSGPYSKDNPFIGSISANDKVTDDAHFQDTRLISIDVSQADPGFNYTPGDVVMVQPNNVEQDVNDFLEILPFDSDAVFTFQTCNNETLPFQQPTSLRYLAQTYFDFKRIPPRSFFQLFSQFSEDENEKEKLIELGSVEGTDDRYDYVNRPRRTILEVMQDFHKTSKLVTLERILDLIPKMKARAFSIASSPLKHRSTLQILCAVVAYKTRLLKKERRGLCSNWLASLKPTDKVSIWLKRGGISFSSEHPNIFVGPGTGIAPFRSACHEFKELNSSEENVVFFGCRGKTKDFYFNDEWPHLNVQLHVAFSRDNPDKTVYVQDLIKENGPALWKLINERNASIYVAGNSKKMPEGVKDAFLHVFSSCGDMTNEAANNFYQKLQLSKRYQQETWS